MGGEADGGRGVGDKMKDIEDVVDKKMSEEETRRLFISLYNRLQLKSIKEPFYKEIASLIRFFLFSVERRMLLTGRKVLPSDQPNVSIRNPKRYLCFA